MGRNSLIQVLEEAAQELEEMYDNYYSQRHTYPDQMRQYKNSMNLVEDLRYHILRYSL